MVDRVDAEFIAWAREIRRLVVGGEEIQQLVGALGGVRILVHLCGTNQPEEVIDDALFSLHLLVTDDASIEDFVCLGGLQVCADLLVQPEQSTRVNTRVLQILPNVLLNDELKEAFANLGVLPSMVHLCKHENTTLVNRNLVVLLMLAQVQPNLVKLKQLAVVLIEPLLIVCEDHFTEQTIDRATDLLLVLLRDDPIQKQLYVELEIVNLLIRIMSHCQLLAAKENAVVMLNILYDHPSVRLALIERGGLAPLLRIRNYGESEICEDYVTFSSLRLVWLKAWGNSSKNWTFLH